MRPQLFAAGILVSLLGLGLYLLQLPLAYFWSVPFGLGGVAMMLASLFLSEGEGPVEPPEGYRFCAYCSALMKVSEKRCEYCNGIQPQGAT